MRGHFMVRDAILATLALCTSACSTFAGPLRAGAAAVDVTPERFPVVVNCGFVENTGTTARDRLYARCLVLDDGATRFTIVIVDSCMMPREFLDRAKALIAEETKLPT